MKADSIESMSTEELRLVVAKALGWRQMPDGPDWLPLNSFKSQMLPNFTTSLDACWEGWEKDAPIEYWFHLFDIIHGEQASRIIVERWTEVCKATPEQRCRTFLKWKGEV